MSASSSVRLAAWALCLAGGLAAWLHCRRKRLASGRGGPRGGSLTAAAGAAGGAQESAGGPASDAARDAGQAAADADAEGAEPLKLRLRVRVQGQDREQIVRVRPDVVDLTAHTGLVALPEELRACAGGVRELRVRSDALEALPAWLGELTGLEDLRVGGWLDIKGKRAQLHPCPLRELPEGMLERFPGLQKLSLELCPRLTALPDGLTTLTGLGALTCLQELALLQCTGLTALPDGLETLTGLQRLDLDGCSGLTALPAGLGALTCLQKLYLSGCSGLTALPDGLETLTGLQKLYLSGCSGLTALPAGLGALTCLQQLELSNCPALHTPPPRVVRLGRDAVLAYLRDLGAGSAPYHLVKVVLLGEQRAGKSSLADSLVKGFPATRFADDRTVGIDVLRWWLGAGLGIDGKEELVVYIYDAAGHRVYRASHGAFMSAEALFLHVVRSDASEAEAAAAVLEWVEAVQQEAPGAVMGIVWTRVDLDLFGSASFTFAPPQPASSGAAGVQQDAPGAVTEPPPSSSPAVFDSPSVFEQASSATLDGRRIVKAKRRGAPALASQPQNMTSAAEFDDLQRRVLARVQAEIGRQVCAVDEAMRQAEKEFESDVIPRYQQSRRDTAQGSVDRRSVAKEAQDEWKADRAMQQEEAECEADAKWRENQALRGAALEALDHGLTAWQEQETGGQRADSESIGQVSGTLAQLASLHYEMQKLEARMLRACDGEQHAQDEIQTRLQRLREQRVRRPRILFSFGVSSKTGYGLVELRRELAALMKDQRLFPHVGMEVPLSYAMLERLAQEGRVKASQKSGTAVAAAKRAGWEDLVTSYVNATASKRLREVCAQPYALLIDLERVFAEVGLDKDLVRRALRFLHATGSVLYYGSGTRQLSGKLQTVVFLQPQFIIDAIKYVIRESKANDVNDELRTLDARIRGTTLQRDLEDLLERGELTRSLLTELWKYMSSPDRELMLEVMTAFKLLRGLGGSGSGMCTRYVVPAMLPTKGLPDEYVMPQWWCPTRAEESALVEPISGETAPAAMRVMYEVVGGSLPFAFMTELQVSLVLQKSKGQKTFSPESSVVDRVAGSVLSESYTCGEGNIREWVVVSQSCRLRAEKGAQDLQWTGANSIRVMAWAELFDASQQGATDWRLMTRVMREIEEAARKMPALYLRKLVLYVDMQGRCAKTEEVDHSFLAEEFATFRFNDELEKQVKVSSVLPQDGRETRLTVRLQKTRQAGGGAKNRVEAFFAKTVDDGSIDVHAEGQLITRAILNPGAQGWECTTHPQPTLEDLRTSMASAAARNTKVIHVAGHGKREHGFLFNADDAATASASTDIHALTALIGGAAGEKGPVECAVLNACSTAKMGQLLRAAGMSHVVCWGTPVHDDIAREFCGHFYRALVEQTRNGSSSQRDYRGAFDAATDAMRVHAFTGGAVRPPPEAATFHGGKGVRAGPVGSSATDNTDFDDMHEIEEDLDTNAHVSASLLRDEEGAAHQTRAKMFPWQLEDVVQFLSERGDSEKVYLWRRCEKREKPTPAVKTTEQSRQVVLVFCAQCLGDKNDMQGEGQKIVSIIQGLPGNKLTCTYNPRPSLQDLQGQLRRATPEVFGLHFIGHGREGGLYLVSEDGKRPARIEACSLVQMVGAAESLQVCLLNACDTESLGCELRRGGLKHVVCWRGPVADAVAHRFSQEFYQTLNEEPGNFRKAFCQGKLAAKVLQDARWYAGDKRPLGLPCYLGTEGDNLPEDVRAFAPGSDGEEDTEEKEQKHEMQEEAGAATSGDENSADEHRSLNNDKGKSELAALKALGFVLDFNGYSIEAGINKHSEGIRNGSPLPGAELSKYGLQETEQYGQKLLYLSDAAVRRLFSPSRIMRYTDPLLWRSDGPICERAKTFELANVQKAVDWLQKSLDKRQPGGNAAHEHMRACIVGCVKALKEIVRERRTASSVAGSAVFPSNESGTHSKSKSSSKASAPHAHAPATKNPFSILNEGTDDGESTDDE